MIVAANESDSPLVSVIIPVKNRAELFVETAQSLVAQTYPRWESIVVDDGSSPLDLERIKAITDQDPRMRLMLNPGPRKGACAARNAGFAIARGEFVIFLDSDDILTPPCLERRVHEVTNRPDIDAVAFRTGLFRNVPGDTNRFLEVFTGEDAINRFLKFDIPWQTMGPIWRRSSLQRAGHQWNEHLLSWQDWEFHILQLVYGLRVGQCGEVDCYWRMATAAGSIGRQHFSKRSIFNRVRLLGHIADTFRGQGVMTPERQQILATLLFQHAFNYGCTFRQGRRLWALGRRFRIVGHRQYYVTLAIEMLRRGCVRLENNLYPPGCYLRP